MTATTTANIADLLGAIGNGKGAKFASFTYRTKKTGELSRYVVVLGASTAVLYAKDIAILEAAMPTLEGIKAEAAMEIHTSRVASLTLGIGNNPEYTLADTFVLPQGLTGIKVHKETGAVYVDGLCQSKVTLEAGAPQKPVNSKPMTIAKREVESELALPSRKYVRFILGRVVRAVLNGETLEMECEDMN